MATYNSGLIDVWALLITVSLQASTVRSMTTLPISSWMSLIAAKRGRKLKVLTQYKFIVEQKYCYVKIVGIIYIHSTVLKC